MGEPVTVQSPCGNTDEFLSSEHVAWYIFTAMHLVFCLQVAPKTETFLYKRIFDFARILWWSKCLFLMCCRLKTFLDSAQSAWLLSWKGSGSKLVSNASLLSRKSSERMSVLTLIHNWPDWYRNHGLKFIRKWPVRVNGRMGHLGQKVFYFTLTSSLLKPLAGMGLWTTTPRTKLYRMIPPFHPNLTRDSALSRAPVILYP